MATPPALPADLATWLLDWYAAKGRTFPWRSANPDPWAVMVSEFLLQQTQTATVEPRYAALMRDMPTPEACAVLTDAQLRWLWDGLGYYRRAENLRKAARVIVQEHDGQVPNDPDALLNLPGVGPYTAGAISAIAFNLALPGVDGNIARVAARCTGQDLNTDEARVAAQPWLAQLYTHGAPRDLMQAVMDIGATCCAPRSPRCGECPLQPGCLASRWEQPDRTPVKVRRVSKKVIHVVHAWIRDDQTWYLAWREKGLLGDRPAPLVLETDVVPDQIDDPQGCARLETQALPFTHTFTHRVWHVQPAFYRWEGENPPEFATHPDSRVPLARILDVGLPRAFVKGLPDGSQGSLPLC